MSQFSSFEIALLALVEASEVGQSLSIGVDAEHRQAQTLFAASAAKVAATVPLAYSKKGVAEDARSAVVGFVRCPVIEDQTVGHAVADII